VRGWWSGALSLVNASVAQNKSQDESEKSLCLVVKLQAEGESIFFLGEKPKLSYFADSLAVVYHDQQLNFALEDLKDYHFEEREPTGIGQIKEQGVQQDPLDQGPALEDGGLAPHPRPLLGLQALRTAPQGAVAHFEGRPSDVRVPLRPPHGALAGERGALGLGVV